MMQKHIGYSYVLVCVSARACVSVACVSVTNQMSQDLKVRAFLFLPSILFFDKDKKKRNGDGRRDVRARKLEIEMERR